MVGDDDQPALLGGVTRMASRAELIGALPNKNLADRLFLRFWDAWDPSTPRMFPRAFYTNRESNGSSNHSQANFLQAH